MRAILDKWRRAGVGVGVRAVSGGEAHAANRGMGSVRRIWRVAHHIWGSSHA